MVSFGFWIIAKLFAMNRKIFGQGTVDGTRLCQPKFFRRGRKKRMQAGQQAAPATMAEQMICFALSSPMA
jgi:hypothetical protein